MNASTATLQQCDDTRSIGSVAEVAPASTRVTPPDIRLGTPDDIAFLADLHALSLPQEFLVRLGHGFLRSVFFPAILASPRATVYVAQRNGKPQGFLITRMGMNGILGEVIARNPLRLFLHVSLAFMRRPSLIVVSVIIMAQLRKRAVAGGDEVGAELFLMAVDPEARRSGVGRALIQHSAEQLSRSGVPVYRVLFHADNEPADRLYHAMGFTKCSTPQVAGSDWCEREMFLDCRDK